MIRAKRRAKLPWPLLLAGGVVLFILALSILSAIKPYLGMAAIILWLVLAVALAYHAGYLPFLGQSRPAHMVLSFLLGPAAKAEEGRKSDPKATDDPADRARIAAEAGAKLSQILGQADGLAAVRRYLTIAEDAASRGRRSLGADRAAIFLVHGPAGTGKSFLAKLLVDLLYGHGAVAIRKTVELARPVGSMAVASLEREWQVRIEQSLDGVLLVDNADWLAHADDLAGGTFVSQFLALLDAAASRNPGKLCVVLTAVSSGPDVRGPDWLEGDAGRRLLMRHSVFPVAFAALGDKDLLALFRNQITQRGLKLGGEAEDTAERMLRRERQDHGAGFDNAEAARRLAEQVALRLAERRADTVTPADLRDH
ncbi:MAG: AAA family ATPase [Alphaproteobacteria bacterium]|nr:AAA family ATPase [Alphaproteobacteria bacterium]